ncbi:MAG: hypothetical protein K0S44_1392 [Bacteroidetes bacterium]|jgi:hypothetical protein|nr:hypothetical protein [Bacteroidota bacterium]
MKKIVLLIVAILVSYIACEATENPVHSMITKQIRIPENLKNQKLNENVNVHFKLENGKAYVLDITSNNAELKNYIVEQFQIMDFSKIHEKQGNIYFIDINFKVL